MMDAAAGFPFARAAAALAAYERNACDAARWAHPTWLTHMLRAEPYALARLHQALETVGRTSVESYSRALLRAAGVMLPDFNALCRPGAALLDCLPARMGMQVLRMRAVRLRRAEARRLIEKRIRLQLSEWIGIPLDRLLSHNPQRANAPDVGRFVSRGQVPPLDKLDADELAYEGYALVMRDLRAIAPPFPLLRLALPKSVPGVGWLDEGSGATDAGGTTELFAQLAHLLPEWGWLFG